MHIKLLIVAVIITVCLFECLHQSMGNPEPSRYSYPETNIHGK